MNSDPLSNPRVCSICRQLLTFDAETGNFGCLCKYRNDLTSPDPADWLNRETPARIVLPEKLETCEKRPRLEMKRSCRREGGALMLDAQNVPMIIRDDEVGDFWTGRSGSSPELSQFGSALRELVPYVLVRVMILLVAAGAILVWLEMQSARDASVTSVHQDLTGARPPDIAEHAAATVRGYLAAESMEEKLGYVRRSERVGRLMEDYYSRHPLDSESLRSMVVKSQYQDISRDHDLYVAAAETEGGRNHAILVEEIGGSYYVDWESHVAYNPMSYKGFVSEKPTSPQRFRVYVSLSEYYNYEYSDPKTHLALKLKFPWGEGSLDGYIEWDNKSLRRMANHLSLGTDVPMILELRFKINALHDQVEVTNYVQSRWILPE